jgi:hypothetical protein
MLPYTFISHFEPEISFFLKKKEKNEKKRLAGRTAQGIEAK